MNKYDYIKHPTSVKILIQELKRICDDYIARRTPEDVLQYYVQYWATDSGDFYLMAMKDSIQLCNSV